VSAAQAGPQAVAALADNGEPIRRLGSARWFVPEGVVEYVSTCLTYTAFKLFLLGQQAKSRVNRLGSDWTDWQTDEDLAVRLKVTDRQIRLAKQEIEKQCPELLEIESRHGQGWRFRTRPERLRHLRARDERKCRPRAERSEQPEPAAPAIPAKLTCPVGMQCPVTELHDVGGTLVNRLDSGSLLPKSDLVSIRSVPPSSPPGRTSDSGSRLPESDVRVAQIQNWMALNLSKSVEVPEDSYVIEQILQPLGNVPVEDLLALAAAKRSWITSAGGLARLVPAAIRSHAVRQRAASNSAAAPDVSSAPDFETVEKYRAYCDELLQRRIEAAPEAEKLAWKATAAKQARREVPHWQHLSEETQAEWLETYERQLARQFCGDMPTFQEFLDFPPDRR
jgi:hypothetical protein